MPYSRQARRARTAGKPNYRRKTTGKAKVSKAVKQYVRRTRPKVETKQVWVHHNEVNLSTLAQGYTSTGPLVTQGTNSFARVGNNINASGLHLRGVLSNNSGSESMVRVIVVGFPGSNGDPSLNLFRASSGGSTAAVSAVNGLDAMYYPLNIAELHVYHDHVHKLAGSAAGNAGANAKTFMQFIKFNKRKIEYKGNTTGYGNQNWMYQIIFIAADTNDDTTLGTAVELSMIERFYFQDA